MQQPTNKRLQQQWQGQWWQCNSAMPAVAWRQRGGNGSAAVTHSATAEARQCDSGGSLAAAAVVAAGQECDGGGSLTVVAAVVAARQERQRNRGSAMAAAQRLWRWRQHGGCGVGGSGGGSSATVPRRVAAWRWRRRRQLCGRVSAVTAVVVEVIWAMVLAAAKVGMGSATTGAMAGQATMAETEVVAGQQQSTKMLQRSAGAAPASVAAAAAAAQWKQCGGDSTASAEQWRRTARWRWQLEGGAEGWWQQPAAVRWRLLHIVVLSVLLGATR
jgi:hypothetical protein